MNWIKKITKVFLYLVFLSVSVLVMLEVIFRLLPTTTPVDLQAVTNREDILRFKADQTAVFPSTGTISGIQKRRYMMAIG